MDNRNIIVVVAITCCFIAIIYAQVPNDQQTKSRNERQTAEKQIGEVYVLNLEL